jgi:segregation and condensation protein A
VTGQDYTVELPVFEGPLDLLLHLVRKHELDIFEIPISFITDRYLEYLDFMRKLNLEVAGEYLLMAAQLAHIKSRELLPTPDPTQADEPDAEGDDIDTRQELIRRLLEYQKYKEAAGALGDRPVVGRNVWLRGSSVEDSLGGEVAAGVDAPLAEIPLYSLIEALADVMSRARIRISHDVTVERLSITDRINQLVDRLDAEGTFSFRSCFHLEGQTAVEVRHQIVVTFLAILEMARLRLLRILQPPDGAGPSDITITRSAAAGQGEVAS